ncbi:MAG: LarC family nickel insertion protein [Synechococcaceae cyanobacterium]|nr:LarC family nickel insertion protein [Synechococcaceae cyanobacterium]
MTLALLDCPTGLAGDMLLAALFDLGLPEAVVEQPLAALGLAGRYRLRLEERRSGGLRGRQLTVEALEPQPHHRPWGELRPLLAGAALAPLLREKVLAVFGLLAEAEASVHGHGVEQVHFHEVGAIDALVDVVGVCAGLLHFGIERLVCTLPPAGHGAVSTAHGTLPVPAPAVLEIARRRAIPLASSAGFPPGELTTPTGLALVACWATAFGPPPTALPLGVGVGLGSRTLDRPNLLRLVLARPVDREPSPADGAQGSAGERREPVLLQQAQIDDATAEDLAFLADALRDAGAVEVYGQPIAMKKGRQGTLLSALLPPERASSLRSVWWRHGTTLGVREQLHWRWILPRDTLRLDTDLGPVRLKRSRCPEGRQRHKAEHEDLAALARRHNLPLEEVRAAVRRALEPL